MENADENDVVTATPLPDPEPEEEDKEEDTSSGGGLDFGGGGGFLSNLGGAESVMVDNAPPVIDVEALEATAPDPIPDPDPAPVGDGSPGGIGLLGDIEDLNEVAEENEAITSPAAVAEAVAAVEEQIAEAIAEYFGPEGKPEPIVYEDVTLTDEAMNDFLCKGIFMVIREQVSSTESIVYTPLCKIAENSDGDLIIHHDF